jgi:hypothetical protein
MMQETMPVTFSFLTSGPQFGFELPSDFDQLPELVSPLLNGNGGRSFHFVPSHRDSPLERCTLLRSLDDRDGRAVHLYWRLDAPPLWWLLWPLQTGTLYTHLREEDGERMFDVTVAAVSVVQDSEAGLPAVLADLPLEFGARATPAWQERAVYFSAARGEGWSVELVRPGLLNAGTVLMAPLDFTEGFVSIRAGTIYDVDVSIQGSRDGSGAQSVASMVLESLQDGSLS